MSLWLLSRRAKTQIYEISKWLKIPIRGPLCQIDAFQHSITPEQSSTGAFVIPLSCLLLSLNATCRPTIMVLSSLLR